MRRRENEVDLKELEDERNPNWYEVFLERYGFHKKLDQIQATGRNNLARRVLSNEKVRHIHGYYKLRRNP